MSAPQVKVRMLLGRFAGLELSYPRTEAEHLVSTGQAAWPGGEAPKPGTPIPTDFPHRDLLADAGITTLEEIPRDKKALRAIPGVGASKAADILKQLD